jgi:hypothetical protein
VEHKDIGHGWMFDYISFTEPEIEKLVKYLMEEHDPPALIKVEQEEKEVHRINGDGEGEEETRYEIADQSLAEIVGYCVRMLFEAKVRTQYKWLYIKGLDPETGELNWYGLVFGKKTVDDLFHKAKEERQSRKKETTDATTVAIKQAKKVIKAFDTSIDKLYKEIMDSKYSDTLNTYYPALVKGLLGLAYPPFCRKNNRGKR